MNINRCSIPRFGCHFVFVSCLITGLSLTPLSGSVYAQDSAPRITAETIIRHLQKDLFIKPGVGFNKVRIGQTFEQVVAAWGQPNKGFESSDVGNKHVWVYLAGDSEIVLTGNNTVKIMRVLGSTNSPFSSTEGASFGMTPHQIISMYGSPADSGNLARLRYPEKGIDFAFEYGALRAIRIFPPGS